MQREWFCHDSAHPPDLPRDMLVEIECLEASRLIFRQVGKVQIWLRILRYRIPDLVGGDLRGVDLRGVDLRGVDLCHTDLRYANLEWGSLEGARLRNANLQGANLRGANLYKADLQFANLQNAELVLSSIYKANMRGTRWQADQYEGEVWVTRRPEVIRGRSTKKGGHATRSGCTCRGVEGGRVSGGC